jgi:hypothetical protein
VRLPRLFSRHFSKQWFPRRFRLELVEVPPFAPSTVPTRQVLLGLGSLDVAAHWSPAFAEAWGGRVHEAPDPSGCLAVLELGKLRLHAFARPLDQQAATPAPAADDPAAGPCVDPLCPCPKDWQAPAKPVLH